VLRTYQPIIVVQEGAAGSKSMKAAVGLARAGQACADAVDNHLGGLPIFVTQQAVKMAAVGRYSGVSKDDMKKAAERLWPDTPWGEFCTNAMTGRSTPSQWEDAYDAGCVAHCVWDSPSVLVARKIAA